MASDTELQEGSIAISESAVQPGFDDSVSPSVQDRWTQLLDGVAGDVPAAAPLAWPRVKSRSIRRIRERDPAVVRVEELLATAFSDVSGGELDLLHAMARHRTSSVNSLCKLLKLELENMNDRLARLSELGLVSRDKRGLWELRACDSQDERVTQD